MRQRSSRVFVSLIFLLVLGLAAQAQEYQRPKPASDEGPPTQADLLSYEGSHNTIAVQIVNLTPFDIELKNTSPATIPPLTSSSITSGLDEMVDRDPDNQKSFMFAPVGIPRLIPGVPRKAFDDLPEYDPTYQNTVSRPYSMVFSWDDRGGYVTDSWVKWTIRHVEYCTVWDENNKTCVGDVATTRGPNWATRDVDLGLWMYRNKPPDPVKSNFLPVLMGALKLAFESVALVVEAANPLAWIKEFLAIKELGTTFKEQMEFIDENQREDEGNKVYLASYAIPHPQSMCLADPENQYCTPTTMKTTDTGDAVYTLWANPWAAPCPTHTNCPKLGAEGELVVTAHLLRGLTAPMCPATGPEYSGHTCGLGRVPILMVTVMRVDDFTVPVLGGAFSTGVTGTQASGPDRSAIRQFLLQAGAERIRALLEHRGRPGRDVLRSILLQLTPAQRLVLREMVRTMGSGRLPTQEERQVVHWLADALQARLKK